MRGRLLALVGAAGLAWVGLTLGGCPAFDPNPPHPGKTQQSQIDDGGAEDADADIDSATGAP
jgi:hypothetical protein